MLEKMQIGLLTGYTLEISGAKLHILSDYGCTPLLLILKNQKILDVNTQYEDIITQKMSKNIFLAPFPNRVAGGTYQFEGKTYQLDKTEEDQGNAIHGLISKSKFELKDSDIGQDHVTVSFEKTMSADEHPGYPFELIITITFKLTLTAVTISIKTQNTSHTNAPYGVGWHPYLDGGKTVNECQITIPAEHTLEMSTEKPLIPTGKLYTNYFGSQTKKIGATAFDTCFTGFTQNEIQFENMLVFMDDTMKYCQLYTPPERKSLAIEPMSCAPDAFNNNMGLVTLHPSQTIEHSFGIRISE